MNWRVTGSSSSTSGPQDKTVNQYTVSKGLMSGQMYIVNVISNVTLTDPTMSIVVTSADSTVRLGMKYDWITTSIMLTTVYK